MWKKTVDEILSDTLPTASKKINFLLYPTTRQASGDGVQMSWKKIYLHFPNLNSSQTISALACTSLVLKNISMNVGLEKRTFQHLSE